MGMGRGRRNRFLATGKTARQEELERAAADAQVQADEPPMEKPGPTQTATPVAEPAVSDTNAPEPTKDEQSDS